MREAGALAETSRGDSRSPMASRRFSGLRVPRHGSAAVACGGGCRALAMVVAGGRTTFL